MAGVGYLGLLGVLFCETAFFFGFFLPGDSLLFLAGLLAKQGVFSIVWLVPLCIVISFLGYMLAYYSGIKLGKWLIHQPDSFWYQRVYVDKTHAFFKRHGNKSILLARMIPVLRSFSGWVAGIVHMPVMPFMIFNMLGSILWVLIFTLLGYFVGHVFPGILKYLLLGVALIIVVSIAYPLMRSVVRRRSR